jgi:hypothetical protein
MQSRGREAWWAERGLGAERPESREAGRSSPQIGAFVDRSVTRQIAGPVLFEHGTGFPGYEGTSR